MSLTIAFIVSIGLCGCWDGSQDGKYRNAEQQAHIEKLKKYVPPAVLPTIPEEYWVSSGYRDTWRAPLVWPWQMLVVDDFATAFVECYNDHQPAGQISRVTHFAFDGDFLIARVEDIVFGSSQATHDEPAPKWVVLEFKTGRVDEFDSEAAAIENAHSQGYQGSVKLESNNAQYSKCFR